MVLLTAIFGGFYLHTFWPLWSPQVVIAQQVNLLSSLEITGTDTIKAITKFKSQKRHRGENASQVQNRSCSELRSSSPQDLLDESLVEDESRNQSIIRPVGSDDTLCMSSGFNSTEPVEIDTINQSLQHIATKSLHGFESTFGGSCTAQMQPVETNEDNLPDEDETRMAQEWSKTKQGQACLIDDENSCSTMPAYIKIVGVQGKSSGNGIQWWYLTQQSDMTLHSDNCAEFNTPFGHARTIFNLPNGYQFVQFSPNWVRCNKVPKACKVEFWKAIGSKFWSLTASCSDVTWDARENWYLSEKLSVHLCTEKHCGFC